MVALNIYRPGADGMPAISQAGGYDDVLVHEDRRWKVKRRTASNDVPAAPWISCVPRHSFYWSKTSSPLYDART